MTRKEIWTVGVTSDGRVYLEDNDFTNDVRLYVNGDFEDNEDCIRWASKFARKVNGTLDDTAS
jgi:hypothetical protein